MQPERVEMEFPSASTHVRKARQVVRAAAQRWCLPPDICEDLTLAASELVTNAVIHARSRVRLAVCRHPDCVRLEVEDDHPEHPALASRGTEAVGGRGLHILRALSTAWGVEPERPGGKTVWAELPLSRP